LDERGGPGVELVAADAQGEGPDLTGVEAAVRWDLDGTGFRKLLDDASRLRWLHSRGAGVETFPADELAAPIRPLAATRGANYYQEPTSSSRPCH